MKSTITGLALGAALLAAASAANAQTTRPANNANKQETAVEETGTMFFVNDPVGRNVVTFTSEAPLEDIVGTTHQIVGHIVWDPENPAKIGKGNFTVPIESLDTGIPLRNEHLRGEDWLNAAEYPQITLAIKSIKNVEKEKETEAFTTYSLDMDVQLALHGQTKTMTIPGKATYFPESEKTRQRLPGNLLAGRSEFEVNLSDFGIASDIIGLKVANEIKIDVRFVATDAKPEARE